MFSQPQPIRAALAAAIQRMHAAQVDAPRTTAQLLLATVLRQPKDWLLAHDDQPLSAELLTQYDGLLARVAAHEPLAYILGHREFYGLDFNVDKRVLIPRPETEMLVELALAEIKPIIALSHRPNTTIPPYAVALDIGTGSGAVPVALAKTLPTAQVAATDISPDALAVARSNAEKHAVADRITFIQSNLLDDVDLTVLAELRVLTANLPYVTREEIDGLQPEIQDHEPRIALDGGEDGLDLIRRTLAQINHFKTNGALPNLQAAYLEFGASQGPAVLAAAQAALPKAHCAILKDLAKLDRVLAVRFVT